MEMISVPSIMMIVFAIISLLKIALKKYNSFINFIPLISGLLGAVLGIIAFYLIPTIMPTDNFFHAILFVLFSGLSSTGTEQLILQLKNFSEEKKKEKTAKK